MAISSMGELAGQIYGGAPVADVFVALSKQCLCGQPRGYCASYGSHSERGSHVQ